MSQAWNEMQVILKGFEARRWHLHQKTRIRDSDNVYGF